MGSIAIIGGSGKVGRHIVAGLAGTPVRALVHTDASAAALGDRDDVDVVRAELDDPTTVEQALKGADRLLIVTPYHVHQGVRECAAIQAAEAAGVQHVVKISSYAVGVQPDIPTALGHRAAEDALRQSSMSWSVLRPDWWLDNLLMQLDSLRDGKFFFPAHGAVVTALDARDLADVAVGELVAEKPYGGVINLTGPDRLDCEEIAARLGAAIGRPLTFVDGVSPAWASGYAHAMEALFAHYRDRGPAPFTHSVAELTGRRPRSIEDFGREVLGPLLTA